MDQKTILLTIIGMAVVTYLPRVIPLLALAGRKLPDVVIAWLGYVPPAVLAAMLLPTLVISDGQLAIDAGNLFLWAALPTFAAAILTRNLFVPVLVGMAVVIVGRLLMG
jgi:branched-subunit amino acid transport protein